MSIYFFQDYVDDIFFQVICADFRVMVLSSTKSAVLGKRSVENVWVNTKEKKSKGLDKKIKEK